MANRTRATVIETLVASGRLGGSLDLVELDSFKIQHHTVLQNSILQQVPLIEWNLQR